VPGRPAAVVFDVIETLMPLEPLREWFTAAGLSPQLRELCFTRTLRDGMALAATGEYTPFAEVAGQGLRAVSGYRVDAAQVASVLAGLSELPAHPDVLPRRGASGRGGVRLGCLTNGSATLTSSFVERAGLGPNIERVITVQEAGT
jgi:2-haloacid dehalogenase